jgi:hypothetical protein
MAERAEETLRELGVEVAHHDLYAEGFEPVCGGERTCAPGERTCAFEERTCALEERTCALWEAQALSTTSGLGRDGEAAILVRRRLELVEDCVGEVACRDGVADGRVRTEHVPRTLPRRDHGRRRN